MASEGTPRVTGSKIVSKQSKTSQKSKSFGIAAAGVKDSREFVSLMSALMSDLIAGCITPNVANAVCNAGGKMAKMVELQYKYGKQGHGDSHVLSLTS